MVVAASVWYVWKYLFVWWLVISLTAFVVGFASFKCLEAPNHLNWSDDLYMYFQCINRNLEVQTCLQKKWFTIFSLPLSSFFNSLLEVSEWFKITGGNVLCILFLKLYDKLYQGKWQYMYTVILLSYVVKLRKVWNWDS